MDGRHVYCLNGRGDGQTHNEMGSVRTGNSLSGARGLSGMQVKAKSAVANEKDHDQSQESRHLGREVPVTGAQATNTAQARVWRGKGTWSFPRFQYAVTFGLAIAFRAHRVMWQKPAVTLKPVADRPLLSSVTGAHVSLAASALQGGAEWRRCKCVAH